jgi:hypothetical protein
MEQGDDAYDVTPSLYAFFFPLKSCQGQITAVLNWQQIKYFPKKSQVALLLEGHTLIHCSLSY